MNGVPQALLRAASLAGALTCRERQVFTLLGTGSSNRDISQSLNITERTVRAHTTAIADKLEVGSRLHVCLTALVVHLRAAPDSQVPTPGAPGTTQIDTAQLDTARNDTARNDTVRNDTVERDSSAGTA